MDENGKYWFLSQIIFGLWEIPKVLFVKLVKPKDEELLPSLQVEFNNGKYIEYILPDPAFQKALKSEEYVNYVLDMILVKADLKELKDLKNLA